MIGVTRQRDYYRRRKTTILISEGKNTNHNGRTKTTVLTPERLEALGITWDGDPRHASHTFEARVEQCRTFRMIHLHGNIPFVTELHHDGTPPSEDEIRFRLWAQSIRLQYQKK
jgi:hypothetical protein